MSQSASINRQFLLASRPHGAPTADNFSLKSSQVPSPAQGQVLLRTVYLSLDPYMRGRMSAAKSYAEPVAIGDVMVGGAISRVAQSKHPDFKEGDWVLGATGWQDYSLSDGSNVKNLGAEFSHPSYALGVLGMPGFTAYMGLLDIGQPKAGETVVVAAASGAVGSVVGQIAKLKGCRIIGVAGGSEKCKHVVDNLKFDACIDHRDPDFAAKLAAACPQGIDVYFENVGGAVFDAVLPLLNTKARIPVCGLISSYNALSLPEGPDRLPLLTTNILKKRIRMQGFIIFDDYAHRYNEFIQEMSQWVSQNKIIFKEDIVDGLENAPQAFIGLLEGKNFGKLIIRVAKD